jgi:hypothetical protein
MVASDRSRRRSADAWDGFFSFEAERRGAQRVLATDSFCWDVGGWGTKAGFELARRALGSKVEDKWICLGSIGRRSRSIRKQN